MAFHGSSMGKKYLQQQKNMNDNGLNMVCKGCYCGEKDWRRMKWVEMWTSRIKDLFHNFLGLVLVFPSFLVKYLFYNLDLLVKNSQPKFKPPIVYVFIESTNVNWTTDVDMEVLHDEIKKLHHLELQL